MDKGTGMLCLHWNSSFLGSSCTIVTDRHLRLVCGDTLFKIVPAGFTKDLSTVSWTIASRVDHAKCRDCS